MRALEAFAEYDRLMNGSLDYSALSEDDFWNIIALAVSSLEDGCDIASVDIAGFYHIKWKCAEDIAKTFMYEHWKRNFMPNYSGSYAASADPGSGIIDLAPLSVDNYEGKLEYIEKASEASDCDYIIHITLCGRVDSSDVYSYEIRLAEWSRYIESEEEHIFPFMVVGMSASRSGSAESAEASPQQGAQDMK